MNNQVKNFLKILQRYGYPNPSVLSLAKAMDYNLDWFLSELSNEIGDDGVLDFCDKAIEKLSEEKGIKIDLENEYNEYVYVYIYPIFYDEDESPNDVVSNYKWGESRVIVSQDGQEIIYGTIQELIDNNDMYESSNVDDLIEHIHARAYNIVYQNCGFGIWWEH